MSKIWKAKEIKTNTKLRIFQSNVKLVLFYGSETWKTTKETIRKLQTFVNGCLRRIEGLRWYDKITNEELRERTRQIPVERELRKRRWRWIGHTLRRPTGSIARQALFWNPQGKRSRGRPRQTWRRELEADMKRIGKTWKELEGMARERKSWKKFVEDLCSVGS